MLKDPIEKLRLRLHRYVGRLLAEGRGCGVPLDGLYAGPSTGSARRSEVALFFREMLANPRAVGAAFPSSRHLARAMARGLPGRLEGQVVELGAGTGAVTAALLRRMEGSRLTVIERSPSLVRHLQRRYPRLQVIQGDARELAEILGRRSVEVVVSSLPLRAFTPSMVEVIARQLDQVLVRGGRFIQYTYALHAPPKGLPRRFRHLFCDIVWRNLPPARVDVFRT